MTHRKHDPPCEDCKCEKPLQVTYVRFEEQPTYYRSWPGPWDIIIAGLTLIVLGVLIIFVL